MPNSETSLRPWIAGQLQSRAIASVVDVGAGSGTAPEFYRPLGIGAHWTAIEIWPAYVTMFGLARKYDTVITGDVRETDLPPADLYLLSDVLEHMTAADAVALWGRARKAARVLVISLPCRPYPQGAVNGNPAETHVEQWDVAGVLGAFTGIVAHHPPLPEPHTVGAFIALGEAA
jgi:SAM-dependent methyltransferase